jgi:hypothetical protein
MIFHTFIRYADRLKENKAPVIKQGGLQKIDAAG